MKGNRCKYVQTDIIEVEYKMSDKRKNTQRK